MSLLNILCPICTGIFKNSDDIYSTSCGHLFHFSCMNEWKRRGTSCPQCRHYGPTTHKIYLSFDESEVDVGKHAEMELKLKTSNERITQLQAHIDDWETNFLQLQIQYTESSNVINELEDRINQLLIDSECKSKELLLKQLENESLKASLEAEQSLLLEGSLKEKVNILEQKLKLISEEFEKEIATSTKLSIENMKLRTHVNILNSSENNIKLSPQICDKKRNLNSNAENCVKSNAENCVKSNAENCSMSNAKHFENKPNQNDADTSNSILIKGLTLDQIETPLEKVVINLASKMSLSISTDDLVKANFVTNNRLDVSRSLMLAQFKSTKLKDEFLLKKFVLKNNPATKSVVIAEFMHEEIFELFQYAKDKLRNSRLKFVYFEDNKVFAKRYRHDYSKIQIENKQHADSLCEYHGRNVVREQSNGDNVDENFYQL